MTTQIRTTGEVKELDGFLASVNLRSLTFGTTVLLLYSDILGGVVRYVWHAIGIEFFAYIPMLFVVATACLYLAYAGFRSAYDIRITSVILFICFFGMIGIVRGRSIPGVFFALYSWTPLFLGMLVIRYDLVSQIRRHALALVIISIAGVYLSSVFPVPWMASESYQIGGIDVEVTRNWDAFGVPRLPGFSKASFVVAGDLLLFVSWMLYIRKPLAVKVFVWAAAVYAIFLTTSKTPLIVAVLVPVVTLFYQGLSQVGQRSRMLRLIYSYAIVIGLLAAVIGLPLTDQINSHGRVHLPYEDIFRFLRVESFTERVQSMWPNAFKLLDIDGGLSWLLGRGLAGIGVGQKFAELDIINAGDNLHVFLYVTFGIFSAIFYSILLIGHRKAVESQKIDSATYLAMLVGVLGLGTLTNVIEQTVPVFFLGMLISACIAQPTTRRASGSLYLKPRSSTPSKLAGSIR